MQTALLKVGELARHTGLSVRTLHHYDEIGLLSPSHRSESGYRLYATEDIARLQQIKSLRQLGFSLEDIRCLLDRSDISPLRVIELHMSRLKEQIALEQRLYQRLEALAERLSAQPETGCAGAEEGSATELMETIEVMNMVEHTEKYYTPEQLAELRERAERLGPERIRQAEAEWPELIAQVRAEMERGTDPRNERVQALARRWKALVEEFTGGNPAIAASLQRMYQNEPALQERTGVDAEIAAYVGQALAENSGD